MILAEGGQCMNPLQRKERRGNAEDNFENCEMAH